MVNSTIYLFLGLSFSILGSMLIIYTFVLWIQERKQQDKYLQQAITSSIEFEQSLPNQSYPVANQTTIPTSPYDNLAQTSQLANKTTTLSVTSTSLAQVSSSSQPTIQSIDLIHDREQLIIALETLIQHRALGVIDEDTYNKQKNDLLHHPQAPHRVVSNNISHTDEQYTTAEELLIDYLEGIIDKSDYERRKSQLTH